MTRRWTREDAKEQLAEAVQEARECRADGDENNVTVIHSHIDWMLDKVNGTGRYAKKT